jgi:hypothetical protein
MESLNLKKCKTYVVLTLWSIASCAMIAFWVTESVLVLRGSKNSTDVSLPSIQVTSLLDTMMMDNLVNKTFDTLVVMKKGNTTIDRFRQIDKANSMLDEMINDQPHQLRL